MISLERRRRPFRWISRVPWVSRRSDRSSPPDKPAAQTEGNQAGPTLDALPHDVLVEIFLYLEFYAFTSARLVCRSLFRASNTLALWHILAFTLQSQYRILAIDENIHPGSLSLSQLKRVVCRSFYLYNNWSHRSPRPSSSAKCDLSVRVEDFWQSTAAYFVDDFLVMATDDQVVCLNFRSGKKVAGYSLGMTRRMTYMQADTGTSNIFAAVVGFTDDAVKLQIIRIQLPISSNQAEPGEIFSQIAEVILPKWWIVYTMDMNIHARTISLLIETLPPSQTMKLCTLFDWDEPSKFCLVDSHLALGLMHRQTFYVHFSPDVKELIVIKMDDSGWTHRHFSLNEMKMLPLHHPAAGLSVMPLEYTTSVANMHLPPEPEGFRVWPNLWYALKSYSNTYRGIVPRYSYIMLYSKSTITAQRVSVTTFFLAQHYGDEEKPMSDDCFHMEMKNPVTEHEDEETPLIGVDFNHIIWIEREVLPYTSRARPFATLKMRILRFPSPGDTKETCKVGTLNGIKQSVLRKAYHIFIESTMGSIIITTLTNELYEYRYA